MTTKKCSGCKCDKPLDNDHFYKNRLIFDGFSNYCINCTKENSRKYFLRKKEKNNIALKNKLLENIGEEAVTANNLMKLIMLEEKVKVILTEIESLKMNFINQ